MLKAVQIATMPPFGDTPPRLVALLEDGGILELHGDTWVPVPPFPGPLVHAEPPRPDPDLGKTAMQLTEEARERMLRKMREKRFWGMP